MANFLEGYFLGLGKNEKSDWKQVWHQGYLL